MKDESKTFQLYGRTAYEQPLTFLQEIVVSQSLEADAMAAVGSDGWVELVAVPTSALLHVTGNKQDE